MAIDNSREISAIVAQTLSLGVSERARFLDRACAGRPELRRAVDAWLATRETAPKEEGKDKLDTEELLVGTDRVASKTDNARHLALFSEDYEILAEAGRGGMGVVYKARHRVLKRTVALKILPAGRSDRELEERLLREAEMLASVSHHNIVTIHHAGRRGGRLFLEMEWVDGCSLDELRRRRPVPADEACRIVEQVARALSHAHARGLVHRDIKPSNILVTDDGVVKVVDFGLSWSNAGAERLTSQGFLVGTPLYMAPEQWEGRDVDARSDLYSLGVTFYELVAGQAPFSGDVRTLMARHRGVAPDPPERFEPNVSPALSRVILKLLAKSPEDRYATADELIADLRELEHPSDRTREARPASGVQPGGGPGNAPALASLASPEARPRDARLFRRSRPALFAIVVAAIITVLLTLARSSAWLWRLELLSLDARFEHATGGVGGESEVSIVLVDAPSKERLSPARPFSRAEHYARALGRIVDLGARAVAVDLLFSDEVAEEEDRPLAALNAVGAPIIHAVNLPRSAEDLSASRGSAGDGSRPPLRSEWSLDVSPLGLLAATRAEIPFRELARSCPRVGHASLTADIDGVIRRVPLLVAFEGKVYPSLALAAVLSALEVPRSGVRRVPGAIELEAPGGRNVVIPVDRYGQLIINFRWESAGIRAIPLWKLVDSDASEAPADRVDFHGQVVFVGSRIDGDSDVGAMPGRPVEGLVWAHAMAADSILRGNFIQGIGSTRELATLLFLALAGALVGSFLRPKASLPIVLALLGAYSILSFSMFDGPTRLALPLVLPSLGLLAAYGTSALGQLADRDRQRKALADVLSRYLSPAMTRRLVLTPSPPRLGGKRRELTLLAVDVHDFLRVSERLEPEEVEDFLNLFFAVAVDEIFRHEGTLDQVTGSGLRAFFGDPEPQEDHPARAVRCALELGTKLAQVVSTWSTPGRPALRFGIGVHTGYVTVGNIGSTQRMEYTVLGRNVRVAEELAREADGVVLVTARTRSLTSMEIACRERPDVRTGAENAPEIYEAVSLLRSEER